MTDTGPSILTVLAIVAIVAFATYLAIKYRPKF